MTLIPSRHGPGRFAGGCEGRKRRRGRVLVGSFASFFCSPMLLRSVVPFFVPLITNQILSVVLRSVHEPIRYTQQMVRERLRRTRGSEALKSDQIGSGISSWASRGNPVNGPRAMRSGASGVLEGRGGREGVVGSDDDTLDMYMVSSARV